MSFKAGFIVGAAVGYVLGAKAGRERYGQIMDAFGRVSEDERVQTITAKGKAVVDLAAERVKETVGERFGDDEAGEN
jgi:hypothetical protein